jgi:dTDP-4-dehydrorhamnose 3,5-epimerase
MPEMIEGVVIEKLTKYFDERGWLTELFRQDEINPTAIPAMGYISMTRPGVARGPHEHKDQTDLFCFVGPSTFRLYLWDNRPGSPTHGLHTTHDVGVASNVVVIIPPGVVHAYKNVGPVDGIVINLPNRLYKGEGRKEEVDEIRHEQDPSSPFQLS